MQIQELTVETIIPYDHNPRKNKKAVDAVANSIKEFGFQQPIVVDKDMVCVVGHTRLAAAKKLKLKTVPVVIADNLTPEQIKAYRLADNKVGELSQWNGQLLNIELTDLAKLDFDMQPFTFEPLNFNGKTGKKVKDDPYGEDRNYREQTYKLNGFRLWLDVPEHEMLSDGTPIIKGVDYRPDVPLVPFCNISKLKTPEEAGICFFTDDYKFECVWSKHKLYSDIFSRHPYVIEPDFSLYGDMPMILQRWNNFRNHLLAWYWQSMGITVIPNCGCANSYIRDWFFDGKPANSTVCVSTVGCANKDERKNMLDGIDCMISRLAPNRIVFYGNTPKEVDFKAKGIETVEFKSCCSGNVSKFKKG